MAKRKRPLLISLIAGWLIGCSVLGAIVFSIVIPRAEIVQTSGDGLWIYERLGKSGLLAVILIAYSGAASLGFGLWQLRSWSRRAMLLCSFIAAIIYIGWASSLFAQHNPVDGFGVLLFSMIFGFPLYYFNRKIIKALFLKEMQEIR